MPKYIKDGAYTIVVDEKSLSTKRTQSPKTIGSDSDDEFGDKREENNGFNEINEWGIQEDDDDEEEEEEIDYTDTTFILQNLSIVTPKFENDRTCLLSSRKDLAEIIASQVRFYCYCAIDAFSRCPKGSTILVIGEGFVGARIINDLIDNGCREMLRICTRGDLTAEEWKARRIKADSDLATLLDGVSPDIVILTVENASFATVCKQLTSSYIITPATFVISCSFGFQRKKLFTQLKTPNIFRTFVEPEDVFASYKNRAFNSILNFTKSGKEAPPAPIARVAPAPLPEGVSNREEFNGASFMATRSLDIRNIIYQLENYYAIHHHGFSEARSKAMKNVLGYTPPAPDLPKEIHISTGPDATGVASVVPRRSSVDETFEQMSIRKAMKTEAKLKAKVDSILKRLSSCNNCLFTYQMYFSQLVNQLELQALKDQEYTVEENNPKSGPNLGYARHRTTTSGQPPRKTIADLPGRCMYDDDFINAILCGDEDYSSFSGPGFDLMSTWDTPSELAGSNALKQLQQLSETPQNVAKVRAAQVTRSSPHKSAVRQQSQVDLDDEAKRDLAEYGQRLSSFADAEANNIDRNYIQSYLEANDRRY